MMGILSVFDLAREKKLFISSPLFSHTLFTFWAMQPARQKAITRFLIALSWTRCVTNAVCNSDGCNTITAVCKQCARVGYDITSCLDVLAQFYGGNDLARSPIESCCLFTWSQLLGAEDEFSFLVFPSISNLNLAIKQLQQPSAF